jgi:Fe2+ transport system protein FeoA
VAAWIPLTDLQTGETVIIRRIHEFAEDNQELLNFLVESEVMPGVEVQIMENLPFNQTLTITINQKPVTLGFSVARFVFAEQTTKPA